MHNCAIASASCLYRYTAVLCLPNCLGYDHAADMVIMGLKRFSNQELTDVIKAAGTLQFDDDMLLDRTSQQLMLSVHKMSAEELFNLVGYHLAVPCVLRGLPSLYCLCEEESKAGHVLHGLNATTSFYSPCIVKCLPFACSSFCTCCWHGNCTVKHMCALLSDTVKHARILFYQLCPGRLGYFLLRFEAKP